MSTQEIEPADTTSPDTGKDQIAQNPNPRANENIRVGTDEPRVDEEAATGVGSEITDGEAG